MRTTNSQAIRALALPLIFLLPLALVFATAAAAQQPPTSQFQLDGTATQNAAYPPCTYGSPCDYWALLNGNGSTNGTNATGSAGNSVARTFFNETAAAAFIGGGSKDPSDIPNWSCTNKNVPPKDEITNAYAAAYSASGDLDLVFGGERNSTSGASNIGIWFFQQNVVCNPATGKFSNVHAKGDIFVLAALTVGGTIATISVYDWDPACTAASKTITPGNCADTNLRILFSAAAVCSNTTTAACAITNASSSIPVTWPYPTPSSSTPSTVPAQGFFTGGIDLTYLVTTFGGLTSTPCISSFLEETRSSPSTGSTLKDFIGGNFQLCGLHVTKTCDPANPPKLVNNGTAIQYSWTGTVQNTGIGTLSSVAVNDTLPDGTTSHPALSSTTLTAAGTAGASATYSVTFTTAALSATNKASADGFFGTNEIFSDNTASAICNETVSSVVAVTKHCGAPGKSDLSCSGAGCVVLVPIAANVCNNGNVQLTNITVADHPGTLSAMTPNNFTLNPGECTGTTTATSCTTNAQCAGGDTCVGGFCTAPANPTGTYMPTSYDPSSDGVTNGRFLFDDTVSVTGATAALGSNPTPMTSCGTLGGSSTDLACSGVMCPLCPNGECFGSSLP